MNEHIFLDIGTKNFCFLKCNIIEDNLRVIDFDLIELKTPIVTSIISVLDALGPSNFYIELQNRRNIQCIKIETMIETYLTLKNLPFKKVHPNKKLKILNLCSTSYYTRKKSVVSAGRKMIKKAIISQTLSEKIEGLKKKDDFYDCYLMAITELLSFHF